MSRTCAAVVLPNRHIIICVLCHGMPMVVNCVLGVQALLCLGPCVQAMRKAGIHQYTDFAAVSSSHIWHAGGTQRVPSSVADVHALQGLSTAGKRALWLFMQQAEQAATSANVPLRDTGHFVSALEHFGLPEHIQVCNSMRCARYFVVDLIRSCAASSGT
jgi:hypothetical protein